MPEHIAQPPKAVILDFYGVIRHDIQAHWLQKHGFSRSGPFAEASDLLDAGKIDLNEYLARYEAASGHSATSIAACFDATPAVDGMLDTLQELKASELRLGLLSNADSGPRDYLRANDALELFDDVVLSSEVGISKPQPGIYLLALGRLGLRPSEAIFVDDNPVNTDASKRLGIPSFVFSDASTFRHQLGCVGIRV